MNLNHIESRMSKRVPNEVEIFADCSCSKKEFNELLEHLKDHVNIVSFNTPAHVWCVEAGMSTLRRTHLDFWVLSVFVFTATALVLVD